MVAAEPITFEVHYEAWFHAIFHPIEWRDLEPRLYEPTQFLLKLFDQHHTQATFYVLGDVSLRYPEEVKAIQAHGHRFGSHGFWHRHGEHEGDLSDRMTRRLLPACLGYRSPFWDTTVRPGMAGGAFLRWLPYPTVKRQVQAHRVCWVHPHDIDLNHPWHRRVPLRRYQGQRQARHALHRLLQELPFHE